MTDTKLRSSCNNANCCDSRCCERGKRGKRGRDGVEGPPGPQGPPGPCPGPWNPTFSQAATYIYATASGSDTDGNGTLASPFQSFQKGVQELAKQKCEHPDKRFVLDVTDVGSELLPPNYAMPVFESPWGGDFANTYPDPIFPFNTTLAVEIVARPKLAPSVPPANQTINLADLVGPGVTVNPDTGLCEIHTSKSYPVDSLRGLLLQSASGICGVIWHNTFDPVAGHDVIYVTHAFCPDAPPVPVCNLFNLPQAPFTIREQSCELRLQRGAADLVKGAFNIGDSGDVGFRGLKFTPTTQNPVAFWVQVWGSRTIWFEGCDLPGFSSLQSGACCFVVNSYIHDNALVLQGPCAFFCSYLRNLPTVLTPMTSGVCCCQMLGFVAESCAPIGPRFDPVLPSNRGPCGCLDARYGVIWKSVPDMFVARIADPANVPFLTPAAGNQMPGWGLLIRGGCVSLDHIKIFDCGSDAIHADICAGCTEIKGITGGEGGLVFTDLMNTANGTTSGAGYGLSLDDGAHFYVQDFQPGIVPAAPAAPPIPSTVTGFTADLKVGLLPLPAGLGFGWGDLALATNKTFYDITGFNPPVAPNWGSAKGTGSYLVKKP